MQYNILKGNKELHRKRNGMSEKKWQSKIVLQALLW